jgi:hypothetical protein
VPHGLGTVTPLGIANLVGAAGLAAAAGPAMCGRTCPVARLWSNSLLLPWAQLG